MTELPTKFVIDNLGRGKTPEGARALRDPCTHQPSAGKGSILQGLVRIVDVNRRFHWELGRGQCVIGILRQQRCPACHL